MSMQKQLSESSANTRTLIMSLVVGLAVLVPLRFYQAGQDLADAQMEYDTMAKVSEYKAVRLANINRQARAVAEMKAKQETVVLGATDEVPGPNCISAQNAQDLINSLLVNVSQRDMESKVFTTQVQQVLDRVCK